MTCLGINLPLTLFAAADCRRYPQTSQVIAEATIRRSRCPAVHQLVVHRRGLTRRTIRTSTRETWCPRPPKPLWMFSYCLLRSWGGAPSRPLSVDGSEMEPAEGKAQIPRSLTERVEVHREGFHLRVFSIFQSPLPHPLTSKLPNCLFFSAVAAIGPLCGEFSSTAIRLMAEYGHALERFGGKERAVSMLAESDCQQSNHG
jgi:hypothetical protein